MTTHNAVFRRLVSASNLQVLHPIYHFIHFFTLWFVDCSCILRVCNTSVEKITNDYKAWYHIKYPALNNEEGTLFMASVYRGKKLF